MHTQKQIRSDNGHSRDIADGHGSKRQKIGSDHSNTEAQLGHNRNNSSDHVAAPNTASSNLSDQGEASAEEVHIESVDYFANKIKSAGIKAVALDCDNTLWAHTRGRIRKGRSAFAVKSSYLQLTLSPVQAADTHI